MKKRIISDKIFSILCFLCVIIALLPLIFIILNVIEKGIPQFIIEIFKKTSSTKKTLTFQDYQTLLNATTGTLMLISLSSLIALPFALFAGIYIAENKKKKLVHYLYTSCNILQSIPAIVIGIIGYVWFVKPFGGFSLISGALALAIMMLPYITASVVEVISLIPHSLREAGYALGGNFYQIIFKIILPSSIKGIVSGFLVALGRIAGEASPLLFTAFGNPYFSINLNEPISSLPLIIYQFAISPYEHWKDLAWTASLILLIFIIFINIITKKFLSK